MNKAITRNTVRACGYIALNFAFVNSEYSLPVIKALTPILNSELTSSYPPTPPNFDELT